MENQGNVIRRDDKPWVKTYEKLGIQYDIDMPPANTSLIDILEQNFVTHAGRTAFVCMDVTLSYEDLDRYSKQIAAYLQSLGLQKGDKVAVMMPNILQLPVAVLGVLRAGMTLVNVNPLYTTKELEHQLKDSDTKVLFILENFAKTYQDIGKDLVDHVVITSMGDLMSPLKGFIVNAVVRHVKKLVPDYKVNGSVNFKKALNKLSVKNYKRPTNIGLDDVAVLQYTGGTTGVAKGAMLTHGNLVANLIQCDTYLGDAFDKFQERNEQPVIMTALPLYHIFAFMLSLLGMRSGYTFILIPNPRDMPGFIKTLSKQPFHIFPAVNTLFKGLLDQPNFKDLDFSSLRLSLAGGMAATEQTAARWLETTGCAMIEAWGMTECVAVGTANVITDRKFNGTIGVPVPSVDVIIIDDEGNRLGANEAGELCVKGPNVTSGYLNRDSSEDFTEDGYFRTGDILSMDEKGYFRLLDRKKDMILVSGFNVFPNEIESVMLDCKGIIECAVIGVPDEHQGEAVKIYIVPADNNVTKEDIKEFAIDNLTGYKCPRHIEFVSELPKSNVGKILRQKLREKHMSDNPQTL